MATENLPYAIIAQSTMADLVTVVNQAVEQGYIPMGGICITGGLFLQAIYNPTIKK